MGMWDLVDTFRAKWENLISDIEGLKTYIDNILVLSKDILSKHTEQQRIILGILWSAGLKANANKCSFGLNDIS